MFSIINLIILVCIVRAILAGTNVLTKQLNERFGQSDAQAKQSEKNGQSKPANNHMAKNAAKATANESVKPKEEVKHAGSTTAYLHEKARLDSIEHAKEKEEEAKRVLRNAGGLKAAERLIMGDSVPKEKRVVICGYCAAENLVPNNAQERFSCYFCREAL